MFKKHLNQPLVFFIRFSATFLQFSIIYIFKSEIDILAFYFLFIIFFEIGSNVLSLGFPRLSFIKMSKLNNKGSLNLIHNLLAVYFKTLLKKFYLVILFLGSAFLMLNIDLLGLIALLFICFIFAINLIITEAIKASAYKNIGVFLNRVYHLLIFFIISILIDIYNINATKNILIYSLLFATIISTISSYYFININFSKQKYNNFTSSSSFSLSQFLIQLKDIFFQRLPIILLNFLFIDKVILAAFSFFHSIISVRGTFNDILTPIYVPRFLKQFKNQNNQNSLQKYLRELLSKSFIINLFYTCCLLLLGENILLIFNDEFSEYYDIFIGYVLITQFVHFSAICRSINSSVIIKNYKHNLYILKAIALMSVISFLTVNYFGMYGMILSIVVSHLYLNLSSYFSITNKIS
tara:strand:- start:2317 stop:3543 length:1227 start_codon:yes stop_codon:yes gene_type:complete